MEEHEALSDELMLSNVNFNVTGNPNWLRTHIIATGANLTKRPAVSAFM